MIIQSKLIRAALVCAAKNDIRYYLNGIHINPKYIEATNGHVALRMEHGIRTKKNIIVQFEGPVPAKAETTELVFNKEAFAIHRDVFERRISITGIKLVDGLFPDMERVIPKKVDFSINPVIQAKYLSYPEKMFGRERKFIPVQLQPSGEHGAVRFQFDPVINTTYGNPEFVVMRCRDDMRQSREKLEAAERSIAELERSETQLINEREIDEIELVCELWRNQTDDVIQFRQRIQELEAKLANPVLLPKTNGYWNEQEKAYEEAITLAKQRIRMAGFRCEGDE